MLFISFELHSVLFHTNALDILWPFDQVCDKQEKTNSEVNMNKNTESFADISNFIKLNGIHGHKCRSLRLI